MRRVELIVGACIYGLIIGVVVCAFGIGISALFMLETDIGGPDVAWAVLFALFGGPYGMLIGGVTGGLVSITVANRFVGAAIGLIISSVCIRLFLFYISPSRDPYEWLWPISFSIAGIASDWLVSLAAANYRKLHMSAPR